MQIFEHSTIWTHLKIFVKTNINIDDIFDEIRIFLDDFNNNYSRFIENNWLFSLNKNKKAYFISEHEKNMLYFMLELSNQTNWFFDPTIWKRLRELGYWNQKIFFDNEKFIHYNFDDCVILNQDFVEIKNNIEIEFWWIWKWYLIDYLVNILQKNLNNTEFLINFGWDMASVWKWKIALESPFNSDEAIGILFLENQFLACSAPTRRKFNNSHHLINPFSWESANEVVATFIHCSIKIKNWWMLTDWYATALSVMDFENSKKYFLQNPYINGILIRNDKKTFATPHSKIELFS